MPTLTQIAALNNQIAPAAVAAERETGLPAELTAAQCIFESAWLTRCPGNNCFGIKPDDHGAGVQYFISKEFLNGSWVQKTEQFEKYDSLAECFADHARLITKSASYQRAWNQFQTDKNWVKLIFAVGPIYATAPGYAASLVSEAGTYYFTAALQSARALA